MLTHCKKGFNITFYRFVISFFRFSDSSTFYTGMKYIIPYSILFALLLYPLQVACATLTLHNTRVEVYFSPKGGAQEGIVKAIDGAQKDIRVMAYSFTAEPIAQALIVIAAHKRGIDVTVLLDKSQQRAQRGKMQQLLAAGITVYIDTAHAIAHNKVIIIDGARVITGSYNFRKAAEERNAENVLIVDSAVLAQKYLQEFATHKKHGVRVQHFE